MEGLVNIDSLKSFYSGKKVFLTGHTGFKGTWMTLLLKKLGAVIKGYALEPEESKQFYDLFLSGKHIESIIGDIRDKEKLRNEILSFQPDLVFHLAAQPLVLRSYEIPAETFEVNVVGTANLLEAINHLEKKAAVVVITTDKVYENNGEKVMFRESDRLGGYDPYSASKACTELVVDSFRKSFFNPERVTQHEKSISSARAGNVIGGGDWSKNRIIPDIAKALMKGDPVTVRQPEAIRPWQHVLEPLYGYLLLGAASYGNQKQFSQPYNFGPKPEDHLTVRELVEIAIDNWGSGSFVTGGSGEKPHEAKLLHLDISKAMAELNWNPKLNARESIDWSISWYKTISSKQAEFTFEQIDKYLNR